MKTLSLIEKAFFLKKVSLFKDLDLDLLVAIADKMHQDFYDPNEMVFTVEQKANRMYFITSGFVSIFNSQKELIETLEKERYFGDESLFSLLPRNYIAVCNEQTSFLTLTRTNLMTIISECPSVAISLLEDYAENTAYNKHGKKSSL